MPQNLTEEQFRQLPLKEFDWFQIEAGFSAGPGVPERSAYVGRRHADCNLAIGDLRDLQREVKLTKRSRLDWYRLKLNHPIEGTYTYEFIYDSSALN